MSGVKINKLIKEFNCAYSDADRAEYELNRATSKEEKEELELEIEYCEDICRDIAGFVYFIS